MKLEVLEEYRRKYFNRKKHITTKKKKKKNLIQKYNGYNNKLIYNTSISYFNISVLNYLKKQMWSVLAAVYWTWLANLLLLNVSCCYAIIRFLKTLLRCF